MNQEFLEILRLVLAIALTSLKIRAVLRSGTTDANEKTRQ
jgi:hypothetical protein